MSAQHLRRQLTALDGIAIFVGIILGSGVFVAPAVVAAAAANPAAAVGVWLLGAVVTGAGAACCAECACRLPQTGGFFVYYQQAFGPAVAFVGGYVALAITYPASIAGIALIFGQYFSDTLQGFVDLPPYSVTAAAVFAVVLASLLNLFGVRSGALAQRTLTAIKVLVLAALALAAALSPSLPDSTAVAPSLSIAALMSAFMLVLWTYDGWSDVTLIAGELRNPQKDLRQIVVVGMVLLAVLYVGVHLAVVTALGAPAAAHSEHVIADAVERGIGSSASRWVSALVVVSTFGSMNGILLAASRLGFAMAQTDIFPSFFGQVHPRFGTPARSLLGLSAATLFYVVAADFQTLITYFSFAVWVFYALEAWALVRLRKKNIGAAASFVAPRGAPWIVVGTAVIMTSAIVAESPWRAAVGASLIGGGFVLYALWRKATQV